MTWPSPLSEVTIHVHEHLRPASIVQRARAGVPSIVAGTQRGVLYYRQPRGRRVTLCDAPARALTAEAQVELADARSVNLRRSYVRLPSGPVQ